LKAAELVSKATEEFFRKAAEARTRLVTQKAKIEKLKKILNQPTAGREEYKQAMKTLNEIIEVGPSPSSDTTIREYVHWAWKVFMPTLDRLQEKIRTKLPLKDEVVRKYSKRLQELEVDSTRSAGDFKKRLTAFWQSSEKFQTQGEATKRGLARLIDAGMEGSDEARRLCAELFDAYVEKLGADVALLEVLAMGLQIGAEVDRLSDQMIKESGHER
jgi:hypothetical protein